MKRKRLPTSAYYTPPVVPPPATLVTSKRLADMDESEALLYTEQLMERLRKKQQRERAYLDRRAAHGTRTPTDEAYEADQVLEEELLAVLEEVRLAIKEKWGTP